MSSIQQTLVFLVHNIIQIYIVIVLLRFMLQLAKADFYNPVSQFIVKATAIPLKPLRRIIPSIAGFDIASLILALFFYMVMVVLIILIKQVGISPLWLIIGSVAGIINIVCNIYLVIIFVSIISSFIPALQQQPIVILAYQLAEPAMAPFRKIIPPMGGLDFSPIFILLILQAVQILIHSLILL